MNVELGLTVDNIERRPATDADMPFLLKLREQTMTAHQLAAGIIPSEEERMRRVLAQFACAELLSYRAVPIGLLKVVREELNWELVQVQLMPDFQGRGLGTQLLQSLITEALRVGASIRLGVLKGNPARRLYERLGFTVLAPNERSTTMHFVPQTAPLPELRQL